MTDGSCIGRGKVLEHNKNSGRLVGPVEKEGSPYMRQAICGREA
jgi:hypothetical protein